MKFDSVIESLTDYIVNHPEIKSKQTYEIYNLWAMTTGVIIKEVDKVKWIMDYIDDLKTIEQDILKEVVSSKK